LPSSMSWTIFLTQTLFGIGVLQVNIFKNHDVQDFSVCCSIAFMARAVTIAALRS